MVDVKGKLKYILEMSKCNHKKEIINQPSIKYAHIYCKINRLPGQKSGPLIEYFIQNKYGMKKNKSSLCIGDLKYKQSNIEIKISNGGNNNNRFNYVQLRMNHECDYLLTAYYIDDENIEELEDSKNHKEYAIRPK
jgi:hypothetical protein